MLDKIPVEFLKTSKGFEPCSGKGGFIVDIVNRFMDGLKDLISDREERLRIIVEDCLYFSDINETNIFICEKLLDNNGKGYKLNSNLGNTLELDIKEKWGLDGFDAVIGNPPYQNSQNNKGKKRGGDLLWNKFVIYSINNLFKNGLLIFIHPSGWRKPESEKSKYKGLFKLMTQDNQMLYLEIHGTKDGMKIFNCGTRYDWYIIKKYHRILKQLLKIKRENFLISI